MPIQVYLGFTHLLHPLSVIFRDSFWLQIFLIIKRKDVNAEVASDRSSLWPIFIFLDIYLFITSRDFLNFVGRISIWKCIAQEVESRVKFPGHALFVFFQLHPT